MGGANGRRVGRGRRFCGGPSQDRIDNESPSIVEFTFNERPLADRIIGSLVPPYP